MDDADEFFDCNNDYSAPVNDSLFDCLAEGIAGFSLNTPKHLNGRPAASSSQAPQVPLRLTQGSPLKPILNNRDNILANISPHRDENSIKDTFGQSKENALSKSRSPLKSQENSGSTSASISIHEDDENVFIDASSRSQTPTGEVLDDNDIFSKLAAFDSSRIQDSFCIDNIEDVIPRTSALAVSPQRGSAMVNSSCEFKVAADLDANVGAEVLNECQTTEEKSSLNGTLVLEKCAFQDEYPATNDESDDVLENVVSEAAALKTPSDAQSEEFYFSPELVAMKALLEGTKKPEVPIALESRQTKEENLTLNTEKKELASLQKELPEAQDITYNVRQNPIVNSETVTLLQPSGSNTNGSAILQDDGVPPATLSGAFPNEDDLQERAVTESTEDDKFNPSRGGIQNSPAIVFSSTNEVEVNEVHADTGIEGTTHSMNDEPWSEHTGALEVDDKFSESINAPKDDLVLTNKGYSYTDGTNLLASSTGIPISSPVVVNKSYPHSVETDPSAPFDGIANSPGRAVNMENDARTVDFNNTFKVPAEEMENVLADKAKADGVALVDGEADAIKTEVQVGEEGSFAISELVAEDVDNLKVKTDEIVGADDGDFMKTPKPKSYTFDDSADPFASKGSLLNSPDVMRQNSVSLPSKSSLNSTFEMETGANDEVEINVQDPLVSAPETEDKVVLPWKHEDSVDEVENPVTTTGGVSDSQNRAKNLQSCVDLDGTFDKGESLQVENRLASKSGLSNDQMVDEKSSKVSELQSTTFPNEEAIIDPVSPDPFPTEDEAVEVPTFRYTFDENADPFASKGGLANSPAKAVITMGSCSFDENADRSASKVGLTNSPVNEVVRSASPVKSAKKKKKKNAKKTPTKEALPEKPSDDAFDLVENPFAPRGGIANSPVKPKEHPFATKSEVAASPKVCEMTTKEAHVADALECESENPFETKAKMANSPVASTIDGGNLFVTKSKIADSPEPAKPMEEAVDPFATKSKMICSPLASKPLEENPSVAISKVANSPTATSPILEERLSVTQSKMASSPIAADPVKEENPFVTKSKMVNSPVSKKLDLNLNASAVTPTVLPSTSLSSSAQEEVKNDGMMDDGNKENTNKIETPKEAKKAQPSKGKGARPKSKMREMMEMKRKQMQQQNGMGDIIEDVVIQAQPAREEAVANTQNAQQQQASIADDFGFSDADFKSSKDFLRDPNAFDVLANIGADKRVSMSQSRLARDSLYVKFDPLMSSSGTSQPPVSSASAAMPPPSTTPADPATRKPSTEFESPRESMILIGTPPAKHKDQSVKLSARKEANLARTRETNFLEDRNGVDLLSGSPVRAAEKTSKVVRNLAKDVEEEKTLEVKIRDLEWDFQSRMLQKEKDFADEKKKMQQKEAKLKAEIAKKAKENKSLTEDMAGMKSIVEGFETTIQELMKGQDDLRKEKEREVEVLKKEKEAATEETASVEKSFSDLHRRFDKARELIDGFKKNEQALKDYAEESRVKLEKQMEKYSTLKKHAEEKIELANVTIGDERKASEAEQTRLKASLKLLEIKVSKLQKQVDDKTKENEELTAICDELLSKVGTG